MESTLKLFTPEGEDEGGAGGGERGEKRRRRQWDQKADWRSFSLRVKSCLACFGLSRNVKGRVRERVSVGELQTPFH